MNQINKPNQIILKVVGGFGNQLFMVFNAISLSIDYNLELIIDGNQHDHKRPPISRYTFFQSDKLKKSNTINITNINNLKMIKQNGFAYSQISLEPNFNYLLNTDSSGYFQSYKFFYHNIEKIKNYLNLNLTLINYFKTVLKSIQKHIGIHIRLTDYLTLSDFHKVVDIDYYRNILSQYDLIQYKIILFSDDVEKASSILGEFVNPSNIILANNYVQDDEFQLFFLACTNIRICPNSSYALWSCYLNDMYQFDLDAKYYFPSKWFGPLGVKDYDIYDLVPKSNPKYNVINL